MCRFVIQSCLQRFVFTLFISFAVCRDDMRLFCIFDIELLLGLAGLTARQCLGNVS